MKIESAPGNAKPPAGDINSSGKIVQGIRGPPFISNKIIKSEVEKSGKLYYVYIQLQYFK